VEEEGKQQQAGKEEDDVDVDTLLAMAAAEVRGERVGALSSTYSTPCWRGGEPGCAAPQLQHCAVSACSVLVRCCRVHPTLACTCACICLYVT
jgi:hypothetical protein